MTICQHQSLAIERRVIRADGLAQPGDENRVCAYWSSNDRILERVLNGDVSLFTNQAGQITPIDPGIRAASPTNLRLKMCKAELAAQQELMVHNRPDMPLRADDLGWLLAQNRTGWARSFRRLAAIGHPMAAVVASNKGRDLETIALTASTSPTMFGSWGTNPASLTHAKTDVALFAERVGSEARSSVGPTQQTTTTVNDTWQYQFTIAATGTVTIAEVGLFSASTQPAQAAVAAGGVVGSAVSTTLNTAATFTPGNSNYIQIRTEFMQVTAGSGSTALTVVRINNIAANLGGGGAAISTITAADNVGPGNPPGQSGISGGSGIIVADHTGDGLNNGDSIQYTIKDQLT